MTQQDPGRDRLGRRAKRFLSPSQKYELWLQLVTGELSQSEAAERFGIDRSTVMRLCQVAKQGALEALAASKPGVRQARVVACQAGHLRLSLHPSTWRVPVGGPRLGCAVRRPVVVLARGWGRAAGSVGVAEMRVRRADWLGSGRRSRAGWWGR
jgi:helix-turn-helix protein